MFMFDIGLLLIFFAQACPYDKVFFSIIITSIEHLDSPRVLFSASSLFVCMQAASRVWPDYMSEPSSAAKKDKVIEDMRIVRPVVETGYVHQGCSFSRCNGWHSHEFVALARSYG